MRRFFWSRRRIAEDARQEFADHLVELTERFMRTGLAPEDARAAARRQLGNVTLVREDSTATGLIFHGESDGRLVAWDMKGNEVWSFQTGAGANAPAITYEAGGEQFVAILSGGNRGFQMSAPGDSLWAFKIGGTVLPAEAPPEPPTVEPARGAGRGGRAASVGP